MRVSSARVLVRDGPLHSVGVDTVDDPLAVVPAQSASGTDGFTSLEVGEAITRSLM